ncbi:MULTISPECIES: isoprenylcysteine carboxyl methyltransferase family protein [unclassified Sporosarcina]|uniref:isoprenylcysteine carboxyl methyltransferase family protein n=1 Tax=unclassified Sporosarcina TaxID=2647733 RepID=UPI000C170739|nr:MULTISPECIES: isoprenylcysteine carboxyl methyltransferase family protein [unclassified Sporosarcina]PID00975.1 isoprenylcysteine carboxyl methyltransferase [Sporosarcina sp. P29]PID04914.1 isoprenylcysteine carboxyl methyltransferase [Sporosarcina sp. P30]PID08174.1 isoprenylcysteine carboxyl methyltransferase [Sporosarcina sp. P31]PID11254.1 isoprenylcysteine carboxyl methyltransferase [Sporosarcina sp. P32b]
MGRLFLFVFIIVVVQRLVELVVANRNEKWIRNRGAIEIGASHYKWMVLMHTAFFISLLVEVLVFDRPLSPVWGILLAIFLLMQVLRVWCLSSLGKFWNTKILILPGANVQKKGPYRWIRHPNYVIVTTELIVLPLLFSAYFTAGLFLLLNIWMLSVRIPTEERALRELTNYNEVF